MDNELTNTDAQAASTDSTNSWLQRLKDESWEAELLVSTISIFGTFQLFGLIEWLTNMFIDVLNPNQYMIAYAIVFLGLFAISILISMFIIHFFLRAYWIGLVGLNSVFPDYSVEDSAYSKIYTEKILSILPKLKDSIQKVDELCSVIFSVAFTFLIIYSYLALVASIYLFVFNLLAEHIPSIILLIPAILLGILLVLQMALTILANIKGNKEKEKLQIWSFKINRFTSMITYGPLYKNLLQVMMIFGSNFKKKKSLIYLMFLFIFSGLFITMYQVFKTNITYLIAHNIKNNTTRSIPDYYRSQNIYSNFLLTPEIESEIVESNNLKIFIPVYNHERSLRKNTCASFFEDDGDSNAEDNDKRDKVLECYHKYNQVFINGTPRKVDFLRYEHPNANQFGLIAYLDISNLETGVHRLTIKKDFEDDGGSEWKIPFYKVSSDPITPEE